MIPQVYIRQTRMRIHALSVASERLPNSGVLRFSQTIHLSTLRNSKKYSRLQQIPKCFITSNSKALKSHSVYSPKKEQKPTDGNSFPSDLPPVSISHTSYSQFAHERPSERRRCTWTRQQSKITGSRSVDKCRQILRMFSD